MSERDEDPQRVLRQARFLGEDSLNELDQRRLRDARDAEGHRTADRDAVKALRAEMRAEISRLYAEIERRYDLTMDAVGQALGEISNKTCDLAERQINELRRELTTSLSRIHGEVLGRLDALAPGARERSTKDYKFSSERDTDVLDLPNPIIRKTTTMN
jgi:hypothetical protein